MPKSTPFVWAFLGICLLAPTACAPQKKQDQDNDPAKALKNAQKKTDHGRASVAAMLKQDQDNDPAKALTNVPVAQPEKDKKADTEKKVVRSASSETVAPTEAPQTDNGRALVVAILKKDSPPAIKALIKKATQQDLNKRRRYGPKHLSVLEIAIDKKAPPEVIAMLLEQGAKVKVTPKYHDYEYSILERAIKKKASPEVIAMLLNQGANVEATYESLFGDKFSVLGLAIKEKASPKVIAVLLTQGAKVEVTQEDMLGNKFSVLGWAIKKKAPLEVIKMLLEKKPNLNKKQKIYDYVERRYRYMTVKQQLSRLKKWKKPGSRYYKYYDKIEQLLK